MIISISFLFDFAMNNYSPEWDTFLGLQLTQGMGDHLSIMSWNWIIQGELVYTIAVDTLVPWVTRSSAIIASIMQDEWALLSWFQLCMLSQRWEMIENAKMYIYVSCNKFEMGLKTSIQTRFLRCALFCLTGFIGPCLRDFNNSCNFVFDNSKQ